MKRNGETGRPQAAKRAKRASNSSPPPRPARPELAVDKAGLDQARIIELHYNELLFLMKSFKGNEMVDSFQSFCEQRGIARQFDPTNDYVGQTHSDPWEMYGTMQALANAMRKASPTCIHVQRFICLWKECVTRCNENQSVKAPQANETTLRFSSADKETDLGISPDGSDSCPSPRKGARGARKKFNSNMRSIWAQGLPCQKAWSAERIRILQTRLQKCANGYDRKLVCSIVAHDSPTYSMRLNTGDNLGPVQVKLNELKDTTLFKLNKYCDLYESSV